MNGIAKFAIRSSLRYLPGIIALAVLWPSSPASALIQTNQARLVIDIGSRVANTYFEKNEVVGLGAATPAAMFSPDFPDSARIGMDAFAWCGECLYFSPDVDGQIQALVVADEDIVAYHALSNSYALFFDGSVYGIPDRANLDALAFFPNSSNFLFSLDVDAQLPGVSRVYDEDVIGLINGHFTVYASGDDILDIPRSADMDALAFDGTNIYYSLDTTFVRGSETGRYNDVWRYNNSSKVTTLLSGYPLERQADLVGLDDPTDSDGDWLTDFEELTGEDEATTVFPGTAVPLSPEGCRTVTSNPDSDGDGLRDGAEAACGTNPTNDLDYLHLVTLCHEGGQDRVGWASVAERFYDLYGASNFPTSATLVQDRIKATDTQTTFTNTSGLFPYYWIQLQPEP